MSTPYFNETGPIYKTEHVQAKEFIKFVRDHVVVVANKNPGGNTDPGKETVRFDWEAFRTAVASSQESDVSAEHDLTVIIPPYPNAGATSVPPTLTTTSSDVPDTTIQTILDALVARFASTFTNAFFVPRTSDAADKDSGDQTYFFDTLRKNLYHAFTHHLEASDAPERCLSFHAHTSLDANARPRSAWEYRLLFVHSASGSKTVRGLVMTVTLEGSLDDKRGRGGRGDGDGKEAWYGVSLESRGRFSGALRAMQVVVGEGFQYP